MKLFNASPILSFGEKIHWVGANGDIFDIVDCKPVVKPELEDYLISLPPGPTMIGYNAESQSEGPYVYLNGHRHPETAGALFQELAERTYDARPDLESVIYTCPQSANASTKDHNAFHWIAERERGYRGAMKYLGRGGFSAYWKGAHTEESWAIWKRRMDYAITLCTNYHNIQPLAFVWDGGRSWKDPLSYKDFRRIMNYFYKRDVDVCYWSYWGKAGENKAGEKFPLDSGTKWTLWNYHMLP